MWEKIEKTKSKKLCSNVWKLMLLIAYILDVQLNHHHPFSGVLMHSKNGLPVTKKAYGLKTQNNLKC